MGSHCLGKLRCGQAELLRQACNALAGVQACARRYGARIWGQHALPAYAIPDRLVKNNDRGIRLRQAGYCVGHKDTAMSFIGKSACLGIDDQSGTSQMIKHWVRPKILGANGLQALNMPIKPVKSVGCCADLDCH